MEPKRSPEAIRQLKKHFRGNFENEKKNHLKICRPKSIIRLKSATTFCDARALSLQTSLSSCPRGLVSTSITLEACFPSSASVSQRPAGRVGVWVATLFTTTCKVSCTFTFTGSAGSLTVTMPGESHFSDFIPFLQGSHARSFCECVYSSHETLSQEGQCA